MTLTLTLSAGAALDLALLTIGYRRRNTMFTFIKAHKAELIAAVIGAVAALVAVQVVLSVFTLHMSI